ncbi:MAG: SGNH/GDSL hydrolase family protein [Muribaculaceae bacterium]|nr:SGNH/GDSL hydrolase family protein [Muribaculaceae bacterium]
MKKPYLGLWAVLAVALVVFVTLSLNKSAADDLGLKTASFDKVLAAKPTKKATRTGQVVKGKETGRVPKKATSTELDTTKKSILFIGDSMLEGLGPRLAAYAEENGHKLVNVIWYSSTTEVWGSRTKLAEHIREFKPNYIFICLGSNELFVRDIKEKRQKYVDNILSQIGDIPYVWIGPPNWKPDTGINDMISSSVDEGCFYLSYTPDQHYDRSKDGAHPTRASASLWMDRVCKWVMTKSAHRIVLNKPKQAKARCKTVVHQPVK